MISELIAPSGPRSFTLSVKSAVLAGVSEATVIVSSGSEHASEAELIVVSTPLCATFTYSTWVKTKLECSKSPPVNVSFKEPEVPFLRWIPDPKPLAVPSYVSALGNVYMCAAVIVPAAHEYCRCAEPYVTVTVPVCTTSYATLIEYVTLEPETLATGVTAA
jgi:hypothetical protein